MWTGQFNNPLGVAVDKYNHIFVVDNSNSRIQKFDSNGHFLLGWGGYGAAPGQTIYPHSIVIQEDTVFVTEDINFRIQLFDLNGNYQGKLQTSAMFYTCKGMAIDVEGNLYVSSAQLGSVFKLRRKG